VLVILVEVVEVARAAGALTHRAKRRLAQPPDLLEQVRRRRARRAEHRVVAVVEQLVVRGRRAISAAKSAGAPANATGCTRRAPTGWAGATVLAARASR